MELENYLMFLVLKSTFPLNIHWHLATALPIKSPAIVMDNNKKLK